MRAVHRAFGFAVDYLDLLLSFTFSSVLSFEIAHLFYPRCALHSDPYGTNLIALWP